MPRKSIKEKVEERFRERQQDQKERDRNRFGKDYEPEHPDWK